MGIAKHKKIITALLFAFLVIASLIISDRLISLGVELYSLPVMEYTAEALANMEAAHTAPEEKIIFTPDDYFNEETIYLSFSAPDDDISDFFYSLDGSHPLGDNGLMFVDEIELSADVPDELLEQEGSRHVARLNSYIVKVVGRYADGSHTDVHTRSYFVGPGANERFGTLIFSLSTDPFNLYDTEYGILSDRLLYERGRDVERPVYLELIDHDGQSLLAQNAGIRLFGGASRGSGRKSYKLHARRIYDVLHSRFAHDFFPDDFSYRGHPIGSYDKITLRATSGGNDEMGMRMAANTPLMDTQSKRAATVFINGQFEGFYWLTQVYDDDYFDRHNEMRNGEWITLRIHEGPRVTDRTLSPDEIRATAEFEQVYELFYQDLTEDATYQALCEQIDVESFLWYYAIQLYIGNEDWPENNFKVYRYWGDDEQVGAADWPSTADGRWRPLIFDLDNSLRHRPMRDDMPQLGSLLGLVPSDEEHPHLNFYENPSSPILMSLLSRADLRERFVTIVCDLMNGAFSAAAMEEAALWTEGERQKGYDEREDFVENRADFGKERPAEMKRQMEAFLAVPPEGHTLHVARHPVADIMVNSITVADDFSAFYYDICDVRISAAPAPGHQFSHWLINGEPVYDEQLLFHGGGNTSSDDIYVELVLVAAENLVPVVSLIDHEGGMDYLELYNPYLADMDLRRFFISDKPENPYRQILADYILKPGQSVVLYCDNYLSADALGGCFLSFSLRSGETLLITDLHGERVFEMLLPRMGDDNILLLDMRSGEYLPTLRR